MDGFQETKIKVC